MSEYIIYSINMLTLGDRLKQVRNKRNLTQVALAKLTGIPQQTIHAIENKKAKSTGHLIALSKALHVNPEWLSTGEGEMEREPPDESSGLRLGEADSPQYGAPLSIPVYSITASMGSGRFLDSEQVLKIVVFDPATLRDMNLSGSAHGIVAVYADGESMLPTIPPKSIVSVFQIHLERLVDGIVRNHLHLVVRKPLEAFHVDHLFKSHQIHSVPEIPLVPIHEDD